MGKTALAMNIAEHVALEQKKAVAVFSLEMSSQQLVQRLLCSRARVNLGRVRDGFLSERDFPALQMAASRLAERFGGHLATVTSKGENEFLLRTFRDDLTARNGAWLGGRYDGPQKVWQWA
jgi:hypothetical protein